MGSKFIRKLTFVLPCVHSGAKLISTKIAFTLVSLPSRNPSLVEQEGSMVNFGYWKMLMECIGRMLKLFTFRPLLWYLGLHILSQPEHVKRHMSAVLLQETWWRERSCFDMRRNYEDATCDRWRNSWFQHCHQGAGSDFRCVLGGWYRPTFYRCGRRELDGKKSQCSVLLLSSVGIFSRVEEAAQGNGPNSWRVQVQGRTSILVFHCKASGRRLIFLTVQ